MAFAALLPFQAIGELSVRRWLPFQAADLVILVASPVLVGVAWRRRRVILAQPVVLGAMALSSLALVAEIGAWPPDWLAVGKHAFMLYALTVLAAVASDAQHRKWVLLGACAGGALALFIAYSGYGYVLLAGAADGTFALAHPHPLFPEVPRMTGTLGQSPQHWGEYCVALFAFAAASRTEGRTAGVLMLLATLAIALTFSFAWVGLAVLLVGWWGRTRAAFTRAAASAALVAVVAAATWLMNVGLPHGGERARGPCPQLDAAHRLAVVSRSGCELVASATPYPRWVTNHEFAKESAVLAFEAAPHVGVGRDRFEGFVRALFRERHGTVHGSYYTTPHSTYLGAAGRHGVLGIAGVIVLLLMVWRARPSAAPTNFWPWIGVATFLVLATNADVERQRHFWLLLSLVGGVAGATRAVRVNPRVEEAGDRDLG